METAQLAVDVGLEPLRFPCDVTRDQDRRRLVQFCDREVGDVVALINNAGVSRLKPLLDHDAGDWRDVLTTNLEASFFLVQAFIPAMRRGGGGRVVNIGSIYGSIALNNRVYGERAPATSPGDAGPVREPAYAASKGGLLQLTRELAAAVAPWGITVNSVSPGMVELEERSLPSRSREALVGMTPLGRLGRPSDIAPAVAYLISDDAAFVTGTDIVVDGGWSIW